MMAKFQSLFCCWSTGPCLLVNRWWTPPFPPCLRGLVAH
jgi:hypothetical protein